MHVVNMEEYGHLVNPEEYSTQHLNNDMYELFNNRKVGLTPLYPHCTLFATPLLTTPFILTSHRIGNPSTFIQTGQESWKMTILLKWYVD